MTEQTVRLVLSKYERETDLISLRKFHILPSPIEPVWLLIVSLFSVNRARHMGSSKHQSGRDRQGHWGRYGAGAQMRVMK